MTALELRRMHDARPFKPFNICLADGQKVAVHHPEFMAVSPTGRTAVVYQPDGDFDVVDIFLVVNLQVKANGSHKK